jgi:hypothetical protein
MWDRDFRMIGTLGLAFILCRPASAENAQPAVAIVSTVTGSASIIPSPGAPSAVLHPFDSIPDGARIEAGPGSAVTVVLGNGKRYELGAKARATLNDDGLTRTVGPIRMLAPFPPLPSPAGFSGTGRAAAVRIRSEMVRNLYPAMPATALPDGAMLQFSPVAGAAIRYHIQLETDAGDIVFVTDTPSPQAPVPEGRLQPGQRYYWEVKAIAGDAQVARGEAEFETLSEGQWKQRSAFQEAMTRDADGESLALLGAVDRRLGLLCEAREEFHAALKRSPSSEALQLALKSVEDEIRSVTQ